MTDLQKNLLELYNTAAKHWNDTNEALNELRSMPHELTNSQKTLEKKLDGAAEEMVGIWMLVEETMGPELLTQMGLGDGKMPIVINNSKKVVGFILVVPV